MITDPYGSGSDYLLNVLRGYNLYKLYLLYIPKCTKKNRLKKNENIESILFLFINHIFTDNFDFLWHGFG